MIMETFIGFMVLFGLALGVLMTFGTVIVIVYSLYDILANQRGKMEPIEQITWIVVVLFFNILGALTYLLIVKIGDIRLTEKSEERRLDELEELADLRDREAITKEEYEQLKSEIINNKDEKTS